MRTVNYKYDLGDKVSTPFEDLGIIDTLGTDDGGIQYHVKTKSGGNWFKESDLEPIQK